MANTSATSLTRSPHALCESGPSLPLSEQGAAPPSIQTGSSSYSEEQKLLLVLLALLQAFMREAMSPDGRQLAVFAAQDALQGVLEASEASRLIAKVLMRVKRPGSPFDSLF